MKQEVFGQDVEPGDEIGPLLKHPDTEQVQRFLNVWAPGATDAHGAGGPEMSRFVHQEAAGREGLRGPILPGNMSQAFMSQLVTDWIGPLGRLRVLDVDFRRPVHHGQDLKCIGLITDKREEPDGTHVLLDVFLEDERGDRCVQGTAEVVLPTRP